MSAERKFSPEEYELLSAYLDDMLTMAERTALEARLADDEALRAELEALRSTVALVHGLPTLKAPRNFALTPQMLKSRTEAGAPQMLKSRTEAGAPQMLKSRTEPGRIIRFPAPVVMSAAASFVAILFGVVLVVSSITAPQATLSFTQSIASAPTLANDVQADQEPAIMMAQRDDVAEMPETDDAEGEDFSYQRGMPTPTILPEMAVGAAMAVPTPSEQAVIDQFSSAPPPMMAQELPPEGASLTMLVPPLEATMTMMVIIQGTATMATLEMAVSEETSASDAIIEILGNAPLPLATTSALAEMVAMPSPSPLPTISVVAPAPADPSPTQLSTPVPGATRVAEIQPATDNTPLLGMVLIMIGIIALGITLWQMRKG